MTHVVCHMHGPNNYLPQPLFLCLDRSILERCRRWPSSWFLDRSASPPSCTSCHLRWPHMQKPWHRTPQKRTWPRGRSYCGTLPLGWNAHWTRGQNHTLALPSEIRCHYSGSPDLTYFVWKWVVDGAMGVARRRWNTRSCLNYQHHRFRRRHSQGRSGSYPDPSSWVPPWRPASVGWKMHIQQNLMPTNDKTSSIVRNE